MTHHCFGHHLMQYAEHQQSLTWVNPPLLQNISNLCSLCAWCAQMISTRTLLIAAQCRCTPIKCAQHKSSDVNIYIVLRDNSYDGFSFSAMARWVWCLAAACSCHVQGEKLLPKPGKGAFFATDLDEHLRRGGITHLLIAGVTTEVS